MPVFRSVLLTASIGGGFAGFLLCFDRLLGARYLAGSTVVVLLIALLMYVYTLWAGLAYANQPGRRRPLRIAFALQLPWLVTPSFAYHFIAAFGLSILFFPGGWRYEPHIGSSFSIAFGSGGDWGLGFNLLALIFLILAFLD